MYATGSEYANFLNIPGLWLYQVIQGSKCTLICLNNFWTYLIKSEYAWIYLNMPKNAGICLNMTKSAWLVFVLRFSIFPHFLLILTFKVKQKLQTKRSRGSFFEEKTCFFFCSSWKYWICFCFRLNIFLNFLFQICCYLWGLRELGTESRESCIGLRSLRLNYWILLR